MPPASVAFIKWGDIQTIWEGGEPYLGDLMFFGGLNNFLEIMKRLNTLLKCSLTKIIVIKNVLQITTTIQE